MASLPRAPVVDGADLSLGAFLLMPLFAAVLSVTMWLELPTFDEALQSRAGLIRARREVFERLAATVPTDPVRRSGCVAPLSPLPHFDEEDRAATNLAIFSPADLASARLPVRLNGDQDLFLRSQPVFLVGWIDEPPSARGRRMSRARIAAEIEQPIQNNRYVMFFGMTQLKLPPDDRVGGTRVDAFLYDVASGERVCDLGFVDVSDYSTVRQRFFAVLAEAVAAAPTTARPR
jgi:hypothetical protein